MKTTSIDGYSVEVEETEKNHVVAYVTKGRFCSSVEVMYQFGTLESSDYSESHSVPARTRGRIYKLAVANGY